MNPEFVEQLKAALCDLNNRLANIEHTVNEVIVKSLMEASDEYDYQDGLEQFRGAYGEQLSPLEGKMKALYGEDYDPAKDLYDTMASHKGEDGFDEAAYVAQQVEEVNAKLDALVAAVAPQAEVAPAGEVVVEEEAPAEVPSEEQLMEELKNA